MTRQRRILPETPVEFLITMVMMLMQICGDDSGDGGGVVDGDVDGNACQEDCSMDEKDKSENSLCLKLPPWKESS